MTALRSVVLDQHLRGLFPTLVGLDGDGATARPRWKVPPSDAQTTAFASALASAAAALPDAVVSDAQLAAWQQTATRRAWQDGLDHSADQRPLLVGLRLLFDVLKSQIPGLRLAWEEFVAQYKTALAAEPVPVRTAASADVVPVRGADPEVRRTP